MRTTLIPAPARRLGPGATLGVGMGLGNVLSYAFVLVVSRALAPEDFGGFSALNAYALILSIPAGAFQVVVARWYARGVEEDPALRWAAGTGLLAGALTVGATPLLVRALDLPGAWPVLIVAVGLVPLTVTGVFQGILLGRGRLAALSSLYVVGAASRLVGALVALVAGLGLTGVFAMVVTAGALTAAWGGWLCRTDLAKVLRPVAARRHLVGDLVSSNSVVAGLIALTSVDVILARHVLPPTAAGEYAFAAVFGKAIFWGSQFVALAVVPALHSTTRPRRAVAEAVVTAGGIGLAATAVCAAASDSLVRLVGGAPYAGSAPLLVPFTLVGTLWGVAQVLLFADVSTARRGASGLVWVGVALECLLVLTLHGESAGRVVLAVGTAAAVVVAAGAVRLIRPRPAPD